MSTKTLVTLTDDLGDGEAAETVLFGLDGKALEIDLSEKNAQKLRNALARYVPHARAASAPKHRRTRPPRSAVGVANGRPVATVNAADIRVWAKAAGIKVPAKGLSPGGVRPPAARDGSPIPPSSH